MTQIRVTLFIGGNVPERYVLPISSFPSYLAISLFSSDLIACMRTGINTHSTSFEHRSILHLVHRM